MMLGTNMIGSYRLATRTAINANASKNLHEGIALLHKNIVICLGPSTNNKVEPDIPNLESTLCPYTLHFQLQIDHHESPGALLLTARSKICTSRSAGLRQAREGVLGGRV